MRKLLLILLGKIKEGLKVALIEIKQSFYDVIGKKYEPTYYWFDDKEFEILFNNTVKALKDGEYVEIELQSNIVSSSANVTYHRLTNELRKHNIKFALMGIDKRNKIGICRG